ncbi:helix-hairpin-helix domain-containing protein [Bacillus swezeyi]|uniref:helix-hairpin-helix domain-containing protein n=1 Tax=Bacillus swezeyi TaxID=1925020 RepID=UPI003F8A4EDC
MTNWLKQYKWFAAGGFVLVIIISAIIVMQNVKHEPSASPSVPGEAAAHSSDRPQTVKNDEKAKEAETIVVDLKGAVKQPGVYEMRAGDRVHHLLKKAGGTVKKAAEEQVNLAAVLQDGMVIYIPYEGEESAPIPSESGASAADGGAGEMININTASSEELQEIPGVGPSKAEAIITYREENGPFQTIEDITNVSGIGEKSFEKIKSSISVK